LSESEIRDKFALIELEPPAEVVTWWSWHDGWQIPLSISPIPLDRSIWQRTECDILGTELDSWHPDWVWVGGAQNNAMAVRCSPTEDPPLVRRLSGWVYGNQPDGIVAHQAVSLCTPVAMLLNTLELGYPRVIDGEWNYDERVDMPMSWQLTQLH
jgi:hypothetical protein